MFICSIYLVFAFNFFLPLFNFIYFIINFIVSLSFSEKVLQLFLVPDFLLVWKLLMLRLVLFLDLQSFFCLFCFLNALPSGEYVNLACSIIVLWSDGNISSSARHSFFSTLTDDNAGIVAASLLISYRSFLSLVLSSIVMMINFYILSKRFSLKRE